MTDRGRAYRRLAEAAEAAEKFLRREFEDTGSRDAEALAFFLRAALNEGASDDCAR